MGNHQRSGKQRIYHYRNRCRYGYYEQRKTASWYAASGSRTYPDEKTSGRSLRRQMPISQNLSGRSGCRPGDRSTLGQKGIELADKKEVWELEAYYIGQALVDLILVLSPEKIILGGGVMHQEHMMPLVREEVRKQMAGYIKTKQMDDLDNYIVLPSLNDNQGIMGALKLAVDELELEK